MRLSLLLSLCNAGGCIDKATKTAARSPAPKPNRALSPLVVCVLGWLLAQKNGRDSIYFYSRHNLNNLVRVISDIPIRHNRHHDHDVKQYQVSFLRVRECICTKHGHINPKMREN